MGTAFYKLDVSVDEKTRPGICFKRRNRTFETLSRGFETLDEVFEDLRKNQNLEQEFEKLGRLFVL